MHTLWEVDTLDQGTSGVESLQALLRYLDSISASSVETMKLNGRVVYTFEGGFTDLMPARVKDLLKYKLYWGTRDD